MRLSRHDGGVEPRRDAATLVAVARLTMTLIAAAVRHAITLKPKEADRMIALFKRCRKIPPRSLKRGNRMLHQHLWRADIPGTVIAECLPCARAHSFVA